MATISKDNFFFSFFNSRVYGEVKSNLKYFRIFNKESLADNKMNNLILNIIEDNIITDVNESYIRTVFATEGFVEKEINPAIDAIIDFKLGESSADKVIDEILGHVRNAVHKTYLDKCISEYKHDPVALVDAIRSFHYVGMAKDKVPFEKFSSMNIDEIAAKEMKLLFKSGLSVIDDSNALGGVVTGQLYQVTGRPGGGKSLLMMWMAIRAAQAKRKTAYVVLGDLDRGAIITRMYAMATDTPLMDAILNQKAAYEYVSKGDIDEYLNVSVLPAKEVTIHDIVEAVRELDAEFIVIDYDSNLKSITGSMYEEGDVTYAAATQLTIGDGRTVMFGSQPKPAYWNNDRLDLLAANESSRKQMHIAVMITIGKHYNPAGTPSGFLSVVKNRFGTEAETPYLRSSSGKFIEVNALTYGTWCDAKPNRTLDSQEILDELRSNQGDGKPDSNAAEKRVEEGRSLESFASTIPSVK